MTKRISVYGGIKVKEYVMVRQRIWHKRRDGRRQRYWHKFQKPVLRRRQGRFEFTGDGRDLFRAVKVAKKRVPRGFVEVDAREFYEHPELYSDEGEWVSEVESV